MVRAWWKEVCCFVRDHEFALCIHLQQIRSAWLGQTERGKFQYHVDVVISHFNPTYEFKM